MTPFEANKTAQELGIDTTRKFVYVGPDKRLEGKKLEFVFGNVPPERCQFYDGSESWFLLLSEVAYADEPEPSAEPYTPRVGDEVLLSGVVRMIDSEGDCFVDFKGGSLDSLITREEIKHATLLSRKTSLILSKVEAESLLKEKLGEEVHILDSPSVV